MCGIAGIISRNNLISTNDLKLMTDVIRHRGPDDEGYIVYDIDRNITMLGGGDTPKSVLNSSVNFTPKQFLTGDRPNIKFGFGHRRLSILDLEASGHQPMVSESKRFWIVYNGEIYNYIEIRDKLVNLGYKFVTGTDTEVILNAYQEWGEDCQGRFNGMWSFVIFDILTQEFFFSRDRFGIKPLYYWFPTNGSFYFASEIKQFTKCIGWQSKLNHQRAYDFLFYSLTDHTDETMFRDVFCLPAGCFFKGSLNELQRNNDGRIEYKRWYKPRHIGFDGSFSDACNQFRDLFTSAIEMHMRSDVLVGSALSGGLDSSAIVGYVNSILKENGNVQMQKTFSSCSHDSRFDERKWMDFVVEDVGVEGHFVYPKGEDIFHLTDKILWHHDEPYQSQASFLSYHVFKSASDEKVKVLLNGQGADEYLSGYNDFQSLRYKSLMKKGHFVKLKNEVDTNNFFITIAKLFPLFMPDSFRISLSRFNTSYLEINRLVDNQVLIFDKKHPFNLIPYKKTSPFNIAHHMLLYAPLQKYLRYEDRNSMANSVEARVPFLDYRLVEFTTQLPLEFLDAKNEKKRIMLNSLGGIIPERIINRKDKKGFITPEERWFKIDFATEFMKMFDDNIFSTNSVIKSNVAREYLINVQKGSVMFSYTYWRIILFNKWMRLFDIKP